MLTAQTRSRRGRQVKNKKRTRKEQKRRKTKGAKKTLTGLAYPVCAEVDRVARVPAQADFSGLRLVSSGFAKLNLWRCHPIPTCESRVSNLQHYEGSD